MSFECKNEKKIRSIHTHTRIFCFISKITSFNLIIWWAREWQRWSENDSTTCSVWRHSESIRTYVCVCVWVRLWACNHRVLYSPISYTLITRTPRYLSLSLSFRVFQTTGVFFFPLLRICFVIISLCAFFLALSLWHLLTYFSHSCNGTPYAINHSVVKMRMWAAHSLTPFLWLARSLARPLRKEM